MLLSWQSEAVQASPTGNYHLGYIEHKLTPVLFQIGGAGAVQIAAWSVRGSIGLGT